MADVTLRFDFNGYAGASIDVYANDVRVLYLVQDVDDEYETAGWRPFILRGLRANPALELGAVINGLHGCTRAVWEDGLQEWAAGLTDAEWEATLEAIHTEDVLSAIDSVEWTIGSDMEGISELEPRSAAAAAALNALAQAKQHLTDVAASIVATFPGARHRPHERSRQSSGQPRTVSSAADVAVQMERGDGSFSNHLDVYANDTLLGRLRLVVDDEEGTAGWQKNDLIGPMSNTALSLGRIASRVNGKGRNAWRAAFDEWIADLTDAEWEATLTALHTERIQIVLFLGIAEAKSKFAAVDGLEPRSAVASQAIAVLAQAKQQLEQAEAAMERRFPQERLWDIQRAQSHYERAERRM